MRFVAKQGAARSWQPQATEDSRCNLVRFLCLHENVDVFKPCMVRVRASAPQRPVQQSVTHLQTINRLEFLVDIETPDEARLLCFSLL
jgi:hypothetical protein